MSGIFGLISNDPKDKNLIYKMSVPYGDPSNIVYVIQESALFGVRKKPFKTARQDEYSSNANENIYVIFSGEIINRDEIINTRNERLCKSSGDAEIIKCLFEDYGSEFIKKISGQCCIALWLIKEKRLHLILDRVGGINNLYYTLTDKGFCFSSNIHPILAVPDVKKEINLNCLVELFTTGYVLPPNSLLKNINKLRPGEEIIFENGRVHSHILERIDFFPNNNCNLKNNGADELHNKLVKAVRNLSMEKDAAFLLSGGIDSSTLVALGSRNLPRKIKTFTASFSGYDIDESEYAKIVAKTYDCEHELVELGDSYCIDVLPEIIWHLDEPFLDFSAIAVYHLFKEIKKKTSIIINGDGPDHLFGRYYPLAAKRYILNRCGYFKFLFNKIPSKLMNKLAMLTRSNLLEAYKGLFSIPVWGIENVNTMRDLFSPGINEYSNCNYYFRDIHMPDEGSFEDIFNTLSYIDFYIDGSFGVFSKVGKMASANDLLVREPYLEREVIDFIVNLPVKCKVRGNLIKLLLERAESKYLIKYKLGPKILPQALIKKRKGGFTPPLKEWLRERICSLPPDRLLCSTILNNEYLNLSFLERIFSENSNKIKDWTTFIFMVLSFDLWTRIIIENNYEYFPGWTLDEVYG
jgi:asparagine synthase (glutamine-hydrolysing)